jgi:hypothetical protein
VARYGSKDCVWTGRILDEEPVISRGIVDTEGVTFIAEVDPRLGNIVCDEICELGALKLRHMIAHCVPIRAWLQCQKVSGAITHDAVSEVGHLSYRLSWRWPLLCSATKAAMRSAALSTMRQATFRSLSELKYDRSSSPDLTSSSRSSSWNWSFS